MRKPAGQLVSSGTNAVVRNANGKKSRKLEFTAVGLPVFNVYRVREAGEHQPPQPGDEDEREDPSGPLLPIERRTPSTRPSAMKTVEAQRAHEHEVRHHEAEQERVPVHRGHEHPVEVPVLDVGHEVRAGPRDPGDREDDREPAAGTPCSREARRLLLGDALTATRRSPRRRTAGSSTRALTPSGSRGIWRSARMATEVRSRAKPACRGDHVVCVGVSGRGPYGCRLEVYHPSSALL